MSSDNKFSSCVGQVVMSLIVTIVSVLMNGWALSTIWNWFIPTLFGLVSLTTFQAMGVAMVLRLFSGLKSSGTDKTNNLSANERLIAGFIEALFVPTFMVGIAYIIYQFAF